MPVENRFYLVGQVGCCCLNGEETAFYQKAGLGPTGLLLGGRDEARTRNTPAQGDSC